MSDPLPLHQRSVFDGRTLENIYEEIRTIYMQDHRPWVIGFSGGKDSTTALQLVWYALRGLPGEDRSKPVYVITADTLVETPVIVDYIDQTLDRINKAAKDAEMPFQANKVTPLVSDTFWVNLIGRGYPAPYQSFRWCTDRLKIQPADRFILQKISEHGEVVMVLGVRKAESMTRAQVMSLHRIPGSRLSRHSKFAHAFVYTLIEDWSTEDVWTYLLQVPSPWGNDNHDLLAMYQTASGECPLVVDTTTPSCGNSRFGCWTCTVVERDRSMESMIDHGQDWMQALLDFRDFLAETQDPEKKHLYRDYKRRTGRVSFKSDGSGKIARGPYRLEFCKEVLRKLLETEKFVRQHGPDPELSLISLAELHEIRRIWRQERGDWEDSVPKVFHEVTGSALNLAPDDLGSFRGEDLEVLRQICEREQLPTRLVSKLLDVEFQLQGMARRSSIFSRLDRVLSEEWRTEEEVLAEWSAGGKDGH